MLCRVINRIFFSLLFFLIFFCCVCVYFCNSYPPEPIRNICDTTDCKSSVMFAIVNPLATVSEGRVQKKKNLYCKSVAFMWNSVEIELKDDDTNDQSVSRKSWWRRQASERVFLYRKSLEIICCCCCCWMNWYVCHEEKVNVGLFNEFSFPFCHIIRHFGLQR